MQDLRWPTVRARHDSPAIVLGLPTSSSWYRRTPSSALHACDSFRSWALTGSGWGPSSDTGRGGAEAAHERTANMTAAGRCAPLWLRPCLIYEDNAVQGSGGGGGAMAGSQTVRDPLVALLARGCKGELCAAVPGIASWLSASPLLVREIGRLHPIGSWRR